jgi:hypothetical protein
MSVTADTVRYTADATYPTADGFVPANVIPAEVVEPAGASSGTHVTADSTAYTADGRWPTADGLVPGNSIPAELVDALVIAVGAAVLVEAAAAEDVLDATVEAAAVPVSGGGFAPRPRPFPVYGIGFGILPELRGEAHGVVSAARLVAVRAAAIGASGQAGAATAVLKGLAVASAGVVGTRGSGSGTIMKFEGAARGRHDDDEAAVMAFLLAA